MLFKSPVWLENLTLIHAIYTYVLVSLRQKSQFVLGEVHETKQNVPFLFNFIGKNEFQTKLEWDLLKMLPSRFWLPNLCLFGSFDYLSFGLSLFLSVQVENEWPFKVMNVFKKSTNIKNLSAGVVSRVVAWGTESRVSRMNVWVRTASRITGVLFKMANFLGNLDLFLVRDLNIFVGTDFFVFFMTFFVRFILANLFMWVVVFMANLKHKKDWYVKSHIFPIKKKNELYFQALSLTKR